MTAGASAVADAVIQTPGNSRGPSQQPRGPVGRLADGLFQFAGWLILGLVGNILIEWACMAIIWPEQGVGRSQGMLEAEIRYLQEDVKDSILTDNPAGFAATMAGSLNHWLFRATRLDRALAVGKEPSPPASHTGKQSKFRSMLKNMANGFSQYLVAAMIATQVFALRLSVLVLSTPVFVLAGLIGAIDGLVQRDVNRWSGGRELGQRYHLAKGLIGPGLTLPWIVYLAWPTTVHPYVIILPFALLFGLAVAIASATFKKYF